MLPMPLAEVFYTMQSARPYIEAWAQSAAPSAISAALTSVAIHSALMGGRGGDEHTATLNGGNPIVWTQLGHDADGGAAAGDGALSALVRKRSGLSQYGDDYGYATAGAAPRPAVPPAAATASPAAAALGTVPPILARQQSSATAVTLELTCANDLFSLMEFECVLQAYRYISRESVSQRDALPLTYFVHVSRHTRCAQRAGNGREGVQRSPVVLHSFCCNTEADEYRRSVAPGDTAMSHEQHEAHRRAAAYKMAWKSSKFAHLPRVLPGSRVLTVACASFGGEGELILFDFIYR